MRIATKTIYEQVIANLRKASDTMVKANQVASSGKRINSLSDDPVGLVTVLDLRSALENIDQMQRNIDMGRSWLNMGESALTQVEDILSETKVLCVEMSSGTVGESDRASAAEVVDGYLREILSLANTQVGGRYIFGGTETDRLPFSFDDEGSPTAVTYSGNSSPFTIKIGKDTAVEVSRDGEAVFGTAHESIFDTLLDLKNDLQTNDVDGIQEAMDEMDSHLETIQGVISGMGAKQLHLDIRENIIQDLNLSYTDRMSQIEDADVAEAVINLEAAELVYQAALASSSEIMSLSLVNYI